MSQSWRKYLVGIGIAAIVSVAMQGVSPVLGDWGFPFLWPAILMAFGIVWAIPRFRKRLGGATTVAALIAWILIYCLPIPASSLGARVNMYAQLAYYKKQLDAQCASVEYCNDPTRVSTLMVGGFGSIIHGLARDDSGSLLETIRRHSRAPNPLQGCERGLVHLYGPYFHWNCGASTPTV